MSVQNYDLYLDIDGEEFILIRGDLPKIDSFTTFFKTKEAILSKLFENQNYNYSDVKIFIKKLVTEDKITIIGSDFREISKTFNNKTELMKCLNSFISVPVEIFLPYFKEKFMTTGKTILNKIIKEFEYLNTEESKLFENRDERYIISTNLTYNIRNYCNKYENFRDLYIYIKSHGILGMGNPVYTTEEKNTFFEALEYMKDNLSLFLTNLENKKLEHVEFIDSLESDARRVGFDLMVSKRQEITSEAQRVAKKMHKSDLLQEEANQLGKQLVREEKQERLIQEADDMAGKMHKSDLLQEEANHLGKQLLKAEKQERLIQEADDIAGKMHKSDLLQEEAHHLGNQLLKSEKQERLIQEAKEVGKQISDEEFTLEYTGNPDTSFKEYLKGYYQKPGLNAEEKSEVEEEYYTLIDLDEKIKNKK